MEASVEAQRREIHARIKEMQEKVKGLADFKASENARKRRFLELLTSVMVIDDMAKTLLRKLVEAYNRSSEEPAAAPVAAPMDSQAADDLFEPAAPPVGPEEAAKEKQKRDDEKKAAEEAAAAKKAAEEKEAAAKKAADEKRAADNKKRDEEAKKRLDAEAKRAEEEAKEKKRLEDKKRADDEAKKKRAEEEKAKEKKRLEDKKRAEDEAARRAAEDAKQKRAEEEKAQRAAAEAAEKKRVEEEKAKEKKRLEDKKRAEDEAKEKKRAEDAKIAEEERVAAEAEKKRRDEEREEAKRVAQEKKRALEEKKRRDEDEVKRAAEEREKTRRERQIAEEAKQVEKATEQYGKDLEAKRAADLNAVSNTKRASVDPSPEEKALEDELVDYNEDSPEQGEDADTPESPLKRKADGSVDAGARKQRAVATDDLNIMAAPVLPPLPRIVDEAEGAKVLYAMMLKECTQKPLSDVIEVIVRMLRHETRNLAPTPASKIKQILGDADFSALSKRFIQTDVYKPDWSVAGDACLLSGPVFAYDPIHHCLRFQSCLKSVQNSFMPNVYRACAFTLEGAYKTWTYRDHGQSGQK